MYLKMKPCTQHGTEQSIYVHIVLHSVYCASSFASECRNWVHGDLERMFLAVFTMCVDNTHTHTSSELIIPEWFAHHVTQHS